MNWFFIGAALALLLWFFALLYLKSYVKRRTSPDHILTLLQDEVRQLEADMDEKTEQDLQLLEEKIKTLRELCTEAEKRIAVYGRELERREKEAQAFAALSRTAPAALSVPAVSSVPPPAGKTQKKQTRQKPPRRTKVSGDVPVPPLLRGLEVKDPVTEAADSAYRSQTGQARQLQQAPQQPWQPLKIAVAPESLNIKPPPIRDRIAELHKAGFPPKLIADKLGLPLKEVELYIAMTNDKE
jgi:hypothetical protein